MKPIELPAAIKITFGELKKVSLNDIDDELRKRNDRAMGVISAAISIESLIDDILIMTLFKESPDQLFLRGIILNSAWCTFMAKRKLINAVIEKWSLMTGEDKNQIDKNLATIMKYRNAFAHGTIEFDSGNYVLKYFDQKPLKIILDEAYWDRLSQDFCNTQDQLVELHKNLKRT